MKRPTKSKKFIVSKLSHFYLTDPSFLEIYLYYTDRLTHIFSDDLPLEQQIKLVSPKAFGGILKWSVPRKGNV